MAVYTIGEQIKEYRLKAGLSQKGLGELIGMSQQQIAQYESGKRLPKLYTIEKISNALNIGTYQLLDFFLSDVKNMSDAEFQETYKHYKPYSEIEKLYEKEQAELNSDNESRHHLLIHHYDNLGRSGRDSLIDILYNLTTMNVEGQKEAAKRVEELAQIPKYQKGHKNNE